MTKSPTTDPSPDDNTDGAAGTDGTDNVHTATAAGAAHREREARLRALTDDGEVIDVAEYRGRSRRSFLSFATLGLAGYFSFNKLQNRPLDDRIPDVVRTGLELNEDLWEQISRDGARARTFAISDRQDLRVNGRHGIGDELEEDEAENWQISLTGVGRRDIGTLDLADIKALETHDMVWDHKCIEGWSTIVHWTGVRFSDVMRELIPSQTDWKYVSLRTPDSQPAPARSRNNGYYVGLERYTMMHPQTLLAWQLNGEPLDQGHGAPVRLVTPLKYGIKQLKRVGQIEFTNEKPADYWAERGYDYHAGL